MTVPNLDSLKARMVDRIALVHTMDVSGRIVDASECMCRMTQYSLAELRDGGYCLISPEVGRGKPWLALHSPDTVTGLLTGEAMIRARDGRDLWISSTISPIHDEQGAVSGYMSVSLDVTEKRRLADEVTRNGKLMQLGQLTATVAHEIRNPLGAIRTANFVLERKLAGKVEGVQQQLDRINTSIRRCDKIITELLDFSRKKVLKATATGIDAWVASVVAEEGKQLFGAPHIECDFGLDGVEVAFDPDQMRQVLINLLSNAAEAMGEKVRSTSGFEPKIVIRTSQRDGQVSIAVEDNGPGIAPENINRIREPLFTTKSFGVGLGIPAIVKILEGHNGVLDIESPPGRGARITARFAVSPVTLPDAGLPATPVIRLSASR